MPKTHRNIHRPKPVSSLHFSIRRRGFGMLAARVFSRILRNSSLNQSRRIIPVDAHSTLLQSSHKVTLSSHSVRNTIGLRGFWFSSFASPEPNDKRNVCPPDEQQIIVENRTPANVESLETTRDGKASESMNTTGSDSEPGRLRSKSMKRRKRGTKRTEFSDSDTEKDLSIDDLIKLVAEKENLLKLKQKEIEKMQDKVLRSYADMENVMDRTKREAENTKKFAIQNFAKSLLDVSDNLGRASSIVKDSFSRINPSEDTTGAVPLLKTLLEGVEMTEKQLLEVFKKFGLEKYDPINEQFDPNRHNAVFQMPDASKPAGTVAAVLKPGYMLYDRVIRPAEVGVVEAPKIETDRTEKASTG